MSLIELPLVFKKQVVHFPKPPLGGDSFGSFGGAEGNRPFVARWNLPVNINQMITEITLNVLYKEKGAGSFWAIVTSVLDQLDAACFGQPENVVAAVYRRNQHIDFGFGIADRGS